MAAAEDGQTIRVLQDVPSSKSSYGNISSNIYLDLQSYTMNGSITVKEGGSLTVQGTTGVITSSNSSTITNYGTLNIGGGTVENTSTNTSSHAIYNYNSGIINISNGTVSGMYRAIDTYNCTGTINISGGTIKTTGTSGSRYAIYNNASSSTANSDLKLNITGGTVDGGTYGICNYYQAKLTTNLGIITDPLSETEPTIIGRGSTGISGGTTKFYNGKVVGTSYFSPSDLREDCALIKGTETINGTSYKTVILRQENNYSITANSNTKYYGSYKKAVEAAESGQTIKVEKNQTERFYSVADKDLTIDIQEYTIDMGESTASITSGSTLTLQGTGTITSSGYCTISTSGTLNINSDVTIINTYSDSSYASNYAYYGVVIYQSSGAVLNMGAGTIQNSRYKGIVNYYGGLVNMTGGTINAYTYGIYNYNESNRSPVLMLNMTGGAINSSNNYGIYNYYSTITNIGLSTSTFSTSEPVVKGWQYGIFNYGTWNFYSGEVQGYSNAYYGSPIIPAGYSIETGTSGSYKTAHLTRLTEENYYVVNNANGYSTLSEAYANANDQDTIALMNNNVTDTSSVNMNNSKNITFSTNGNTVTLTNPIYISSGTLTKTEEGTIKNDDSNVIELSGNSTLNVRSGELKSTVGSAIYQSGSSATIEIGNSSDEFNTKNPVVTGETYGIDSNNISSCKVNMYNGIIRGKTSALTNNVRMEDMAGSLREDYVSADIYNDNEGYKCLALRKSTAIITKNPVKATRAVEEAVTFSITVEGEEPLSYQWYKNSNESNVGGTLIEGATSNTYTITSITENDAGYYYCEASSERDMSASMTAELVVASIYSITNTSNSTTKYYGELNTAVSAATAGQTIKLLQNVTDESTVTISKNITLDIQSYTLTTIPTITISSGTINIQGTGTITRASGVPITCSGTGTLNINNITIEGVSGSTMSIGGSKTINITDATINGTINNNNNSNSIVNIYGGIVTGSYYAIYTYSYSSSYKPVTNVINGTVKGGLYGIYNNGSYATTNIGDSATQLSITDPIIIGGTNGVYNSSGSWNFYNGIIKGKNSPYTGSAATNVRDGYAETQGEEIIEGETYITTYLGEGNYGITTNGITKGYGTLTKAVAAATSGQTISPLRNIKDSTSDTISKNVALDLQSYTITRSASISINSGATLTIKGSGLITSSSASPITNYGTLNIEAGTIENTYQYNSPSAIKNYSSGIINISGGVVRTNIGNGNTNAKTIDNSNCNGTVNMTGGKVEALANSSYIVYGIYNSSTSSSYRPTINIKAGIVEGKYYGIYNYGSYATANIGDSTKELDNSTPVIIGYVGISNGNSAKWNFYNGTLKGIRGGFHINPVPTTIEMPTTVRTGYAVTVGENEIINGETYKTEYVGAGQYSITTNGTTKGYYDFATALSAATNGQTIKLLTNFSDGSTITVAKNVYLDLQNYTLTRGSVITISSGGTLNIQGERGELVSGVQTYAISNSGTLNISGGTITATNQAALTGCASIQNNSGTITITGGRIIGKYNTILSTSGTINVLGGEVVATEGGAVQSSGTINIGREEDSLSTTNPLISSETEPNCGHSNYGLYATTWNFYNGKIKGSYAAYYPSPKAVRSGAQLKTGTEIDENGIVYYIAYLTE